MSLINRPNLFKAIINAMKSLKGIDKSLTVGSGSSSYKGVADKDVKTAVAKVMEENGLGILPVKIEPKTTIERWEETTQFGQNPPVTKIKQSVLTEVLTTYLLFHESGECIEIQGYGHGIDTQDKSAGKATTYALKYALLYTFMVPTGKIDDADVEHSESVSVVPKATKPQKLAIETAKLKKEIDFFDNVDQFVDFRSLYALSAEQKAIVTEKFNELFPNYQKAAK